MKEPCLTDAKSLREKRQGRFSYGMMGYVEILKEGTKAYLSQTRLGQKTGEKRKKPVEEKRRRLRGQEVKTSPFHGGNTGSIPVGVTCYLEGQSNDPKGIWTFSSVG